MGLCVPSALLYLGHFTLIRLVVRVEVGGGVGVGGHGRNGKLKEKNFSALLLSSPVR